MQIATWSIASFWLAIADAVGAAGLDPNFAHSRCAERKAGDCGLTFDGIATPPLAAGSGKFGTPLARMHSASFSKGPPVAEALLDMAEDPHATIATAQHAAASEVEGRWPVGGLTNFALRICRASHSIEGTSVIQSGR
jgi:hypothetical protein